MLHGGLAYLAFLVLYNLTTNKSRLREEYYDADDFVINARCLLGEAYDRNPSGMSSELYRFYDEHYLTYQYLLGERGSVKQMRFQVKIIHQNKCNSRKLFAQLI